jgi:predicted phosphoribosyltransferase
MTFRDRREAGRQLADALKGYRARRPFILAIPRGGIVVGYEVALGLDAPLDVVVPRKLRAPYNPELAVGAVAHDGSVYVDSPLVSSLRIPEDYLKEEMAAQLEEIRRRMTVYRGDRPQPDVSGRAAIVVDDGIATGSTMIAALRAVRARHPAKLIAATGVASAEALRLIRQEADEVVCLETPALLYAIGYHFRDFSQVSDEEVVATLREARRPGVATGPNA